MTLHLARDLDLPDDAVTETFGILAVKRAGKSNAAVVLAEEMYDAGLPWVAIDPKGDWWGVRSAGAGNKPGLSVVVFGGEHGDVPLEPTGGAMVAELIAEKRMTCVLDVSEMAKTDQRRFLTDFATRLYKRNREPLHVFCEEADEYIPQVVRGDSAKLVGAWETLVKRGGFRGIGVTLITQRSASLNNDVLTQVGTLIAMRTPHIADRKKITDWVKYHDAAIDMVDQLPMLAAGEAFVFSPEWLPRVGLGPLHRIRFRQRRTFDSGATPAIGEKRVTPTRLADVDLAAIKEQMAETIERAKADDPKTLRARIRELEQELKKRPTETVTERVEVPVEVSVVPEAAAAELRALLAEYDRAIAAAAEVADRFERHAGTLEAAISGADAPRAPRTSPKTAPTSPTTQPTTPKNRPSSPNSTLRAVPTPRASTGPGEVKIPKMECAILTVLAQHPEGRTNSQLTTLTGYRYSGGFMNALSALRTNGYMVGGNKEVMRATEEGLDTLGEWEPLPTGSALLHYWLTEQLRGMERVIVSHLVEVYPTEIAGPDLAVATGYEYSGGFMNALSKLRTLRLIVGKNMEGMRADEDFMDAIS